jgi:hypothetical protein
MNAGQGAATEVKWLNRLNELNRFFAIFGGILGSLVRLFVKGVAPLLRLCCGSDLNFVSYLPRCCGCCGSGGGKGGCAHIHTVQSETDHPKSTAHSHRKQEEPLNRKTLLRTHSTVEGNKMEPPHPATRDCYKIIFAGCDNADFWRQSGFRSEKEVERLPEGFSAGK